jgi:hypothetical protein
MRAWRLALVAVLLWSPSALGGIVYTESTDGDLSSDRLTPTLVSLLEGSNDIVGSVVKGDVDYFTITVPDDFELAAIFVKSYVSDDRSGTIAVMEGDTFTVPVTGLNSPDLLGWSKFGTATLGTDILDNMGMGEMSQGFAGPLGPGDYSFWVQQTSNYLSNYTFEFVLVPDLDGSAEVPEASSLAMLSGLAGVGLALRTWRRRQRRS